jgi:hypothetical protein
LWIIAVIVGLIAIALFIFWIPLDMVLNADVHGKPGLRLRFSWFFGLVSREIPGIREKPSAKKKAPSDRKKGGWRDARIMLRIIRTEGLLKRLMKLVKEVFSCFRWKETAADFKVGLGDPADTGLLFCILGPATVFLGNSGRHRINIEPYFGDDAILEGCSSGTARLRPVRLLPPFFRFAFSPPAIKAVRTLITEKWKRKK